MLPVCDKTWGKFPPLAAHAATWRLGARRLWPRAFPCARMLNSSVVRRPRSAPRLGFLSAGRLRGRLLAHLVLGGLALAVLVLHE
eukprot:2796161-Lingulodinium_polyedra.AAC.1